MQKSVVYVADKAVLTNKQTTVMSVFCFKKLYC